RASIRQRRQRARELTLLAALHAVGHVGHRRLLPHPPKRLSSRPERAAHARWWRLPRLDASTRGVRSAEGLTRGCQGAGGGESHRSRPFGPRPYDAGSGGAEREGSVSEPGRDASRDHEAFWVEQAERLAWTRPWDTVMEWNPPWVTWFAGGQLNASANCLDRHVE